MDPSCHDLSRGGRHPKRVRDRVIPVMSLVVAGLFSVATWQVAGRVREYNSQRAVGGLIVAGLMAHPAANGTSTVNERTGLPWLSFPPGAASGPADAEIANEPAGEATSDVRPLSMPELTRATGQAEAVVWAWERALYCTAGIVALAGLIGLLTRWVRGPHLVAAVAIILSTVGTVVAMRVLVDPARAAFHPLPLESYMLAAVCQAAYGLVLSVAMIRKT